MNFDDNAQFRQKDIFILDESKEDMVIDFFFL